MGYARQAKHFGKGLFAGCLVFIGTSLAMADTPAPSKWETMLTRISASGSSANFGDETSLSLGHLEPQDLSKPHKASYISEFGIMSGPKFVPRSVSAVAEDWSLNASGNWLIDQVIYTVSLSGELKSVYHAQIEENRRHDVLKNTYIPMAPVTAPETQALWQNNLAPWLAGQY